MNRIKILIMYFFIFDLFLNYEAKKQINRKKAKNIEN